MHSERQWFNCSPFAPLRFFPPRRAPCPRLPLSPNALLVQIGFFCSPQRGPPAKKRGHSWGEAPQLVQIVTLSFCPDIAVRGERALPCCAMVGLSPIRCVDWRPVVQLSAAGKCGAPWPCGLVVARPAGGGGCVAGARGGGLEPSAPQRVSPQSVQYAAVVRSLCSVGSLAAACRCASDGSTLDGHHRPAPSADTGN